jgi:hypothetical protein
VLFPGEFGLDLTATAATVKSPASSAVNIVVGGQVNDSGVVTGGSQIAVNPGELLTPAQYVAVTQVVQTGNQYIQLDADGAANAGTLSLTAQQTDSLSHLVIPNSVVLNSVGFTEADPLVVLGSTSIGGSLFALQSAPSIPSTFNFGNLTLTGSGLLSGSLLPGAEQTSGLFSSSGLVLSIAATLVNSGTIASPGVLAINAGSNVINYGNITTPGTLAITSAGGLSNFGTVSGGATSVAAAQAFINSGAVTATAGNLNVGSAAGAFTNSGSLAAPIGNININTMTANAVASSINFNNAGGRLTALNAINFREASFSGNSDISITGGDLISNSLNLNVGQGTTNVAVNQLTGVLSTYGGAAHVSANTENLVLGDQCLLGDPTYYNNGDITINGDITVGDRLAVIASRDILNSGAGGYTIRARAAVGGVGQDITLISGAAFTPTGAGPGVATLSGNPPPPLGEVPLGGTILVTGASATGGNISLSTNGGVSLIDASGTAGGGGDVTLLAFSNAAGNARGQILLPATSVVNTSGFDRTTNGDILVGAGRTAGGGVQAIRLGTLDADGGATTAGGTITVRVNQPAVSAGGVLFNSSGAISNGGSFTVSTPSAGASNNSIAIGAGAAQAISARGNVIVESNGNVSWNAGGISTAGGAYNSRSLSFNLTGNLNGGTLSTGGGDVSLQAGNTLTLTNSTLSTGSGNLNATAAQIGAGSIIRGSAGTVNAVFSRGNLQVGPFTSSGATLFQTGLGGDIATQGAVTNTGGGLTFRSMGVVGDGGNITLNHAITESGLGDLSVISAGGGASSSNIVVNAAVSESGAGNLLLQTSGADSDVRINADVSSAFLGLTTVVTGSTGTASLDIGAGATLSGSSLSVVTPALNVANAGRVLGTAGDLQISSNFPSQRLNVALSGPTSTIESTGGNVIFNTSVAPGQITATGGPANGVITANSGNGMATFNGGAAAVNVNVNQINGCIGGTGSPFNITVNQPGVLGDVRIGGITAGSGITVDATNSSILVCDDVTTTNAGSNISLRSGTAAVNQIAFASNADLLARNNITLTTPNLLLTGGNSTITATAGDVSIQSNRVGGNRLDLTVGAGSAINAAAATGDIFFNPSTAGQIVITGVAPADGLLNAGNTVSYRGGAVSTSVSRINGRVVSSGTVASASVTTNAAGNTLNIGPFTSSGASSFTANNGNIFLTGDVTSTLNDVSITTGTGAANQIAFALNADVIARNNAIAITPNVLLTGGNNRIIATTGDVSVQSNSVSANSLSVTMGPGSSINAATPVTGDIFFNPSTEGQISVLGVAPTNGLLNAGNTVSYRGGAVSTNVNLINGRVVSNGASVTTASISTNAGSNVLNVGPFTSSGITSFTASGTGSDLVTRGVIDSGAGNLALQAGTGGNADVRVNFNATTSGTLAVTAGAGANSDVTVATGAALSGGVTNVTTPRLVVNGTGSVLATAGDLQISSNATNQVLSVALTGATSTLQSATGNVNFNTTAAPGQILLTGGPGNGAIAANGGNGMVIFNGGGASVNASSRQISGCISGSGTAFNVTSAQPGILGDLRIGSITSGTGITFTTNTDILVCGDITTTGGNITLTSGTAAKIAFAANADLAASDGITLRSPRVLLTGGNNTVTASGANLTIDSNAVGNALQVTLGNSSTLRSNNNVVFNIAGAANEGPITVTGQGLVQGTSIDYNVGRNTLSVDVRQLLGGNRVFGAGGNPTIVNLTTQVGSVNVRSNLSVSNAAGNAGILNVTANGGTVDLGGFSLTANGGAGSGGRVGVTAAGGITNGGNLSANGTASGGSISLSSPGQNIAVTTIFANGTGGAGGSVTTNSGNLSVAGAVAGESVCVDGGTTGGTISIATTSTNQFVIGSSIPNGTFGGICADGGTNGGRIAVAGNGATVNGGQSITANGTTGAGGVVTFDANNVGATFNVNGTVSAVGATANTGVIGIGAAAFQPLTLNLGGGLFAGRQVTIGNIDPLTGLPAGPPAGLLTLNPFPPAALPQAPYNTPLVVLNGLVPPLPPVTPVSPAPALPGPSQVTAVSARVTATEPASSGLNALLAALLAGQTGQLDAALLGLRIPIDLTSVLSRAQLNEDEAEADEEEEIARQRKKGQHQIFGSVTYKGTFDQAERDRLAKEGVVMNVDTEGSNFSLERGNLVFAPPTDITVATREGRVYVPGGAIVFIVDTGKDVAIYDLHQTKLDAVKIVSAKKLIKLNPGRLLVLTRQQTRDFDRVSGEVRSIGYRHAREEDINEEIKAFAMDFSIPSALTVVAPLQQMLKEQSGVARIAMTNILKSSALLMELTASAGPFRSADKQP